MEANSGFYTTYRDPHTNKICTRNQLIVTLHSDGYSMHYIKEQCHCCKKHIEEVLEAKHNGVDIDTILPQRGRPKKLKKRTVPEIFEFFSENASGKISDQKLKDKIIATFPEFNNSLSRSTVNRWRHQFHFEFKPPKRRQMLTEIQIQKRLDFAYSLLGLSPNFFSFIFSDESRVCLGPDNHWVWRRRSCYDPEVFEDESKFPVGVMIYGAIGFNYKSKLVFTDNKIDARTYAGNIVASEMIHDIASRNQLKSVLFQQDGAPAHRARELLEWLKTQISFLKVWPANSPDLNVIENLWGIIKARINQMNPRPADIPSLKKAIQEIWDSLHQSMINNLVLTFHYRLLLCIIHEGNCIQPFIRHNPEDYPAVVPPAPSTVTFYTAADMFHIYDENIPQIEGFVPLNFQTVIRSRYTESENRILLDKYREFGDKWKKISMYLPGRTWESVRGHFFSKEFRNFMINGQRS